MLQKENIEWLLALSYVYLQSHKYDKAIVLLRSILLFDEKNLEALKAISYGYYKLALYEDAFYSVKNWLKYKSKKHKSEEAHIYLLQSKILLKLNRKDLAKKCLNKSKQLMVQDDV